jgi:hypothetical protein
LNQTAFGDSVLSYRHNIEPSHGIGNGAGPTIWAMVGTPILNSLRESGCGVVLTHPISKMDIQIPLFAFVDDNDLVQDLNTSTSLNTQAVQHAVDIWERGLCTTGGALVPDKCMWYALRHIWEKDSWILQRIHDSDIPLTINSDCGVRECLTHYEPFQAVKSLGIMFAPSGDATDETAYLIEKGK